MILWQHHRYSEERSAHSVSGDRVLVGRGDHCDVRLGSAFVANQALAFERMHEGWQLEILGHHGCKFGGHLLQCGEKRMLHDGAEVLLDPYVLKVDYADLVSSQTAAEESQLDEQIAALIRQIHVRLLDTFGRTETDFARDQGGKHLLQLEKTIDELAIENGLLQPEQEPMLRRLAGYAVRNAIIDQIIGESAAEDPLSAQERKWVALASAVDQRETELKTLANRIETHLGFQPGEGVQSRMANIDKRYWECWNSKINLLQEFFVYLARREIKKQVKDLIYGYGPIEDLLRLPTVSEIMVIGHDQIYVEKREKSGGTIENSGRRFVSEAATLSVIERIVSRCNRRIDQSQPLVDARLDDGSRVNAVISPIAVSGPCLTIRRFPKRQHRIQSWIDSGGLTPLAAKFLEAAVRGRRNIMIIGGTGAGKTTLLNCMTDWIPTRERIVTIEDTAELQPMHDHVVQLQTRPKNADGSGAVTTQDLVKNALRMRPERVIVGECRGGEALDMLNAMNTGHDGSMTTLHANSPQEVGNRLESMVKSAADFSEKAIHQQIASALDMIVQVEHRLDHRLGKKRRLVSCISEVREIDPYTERVQVIDLYSIPMGSTKLQLCPTGRLPSFGAELAEQNLFDLATFCPGLESGDANL